MSLDLELLAPWKTAIESCNRVRIIRHQAKFMNEKRTTKHLTVRLQGTRLNPKKKHGFVQLMLEIALP